ncbi:hypothetical protein Ae201684P_010737 [Aphanomyces euteiches]|nr:hypothetical protein Ae201684P_010737 [Aphanomyces euteiches]
MILLGWIPAYGYARIPFIQLFQTTTSQNSAFSKAVDDGLSGQMLPYIICPFYKIKPRWTFKLPFTRFQAILEWTHPSHIGRLAFPSESWRDFSKNH